MAGHLCKLTQDQPIDLNCEALLEVANKLHLMRSDMPCIHLNGDEALPDRNHIFRIYNFPEEWKTKHIQEAFKNVSSTVIKWVDDTSAFVVLKDTKKSEVVLNWCNPDKKKKKRPFELESYASYHVRTQECKYPSSPMSGFYVNQS